MLNNLLKNELGFQGFVMSDWQAQHTGAASAVAGLVTNLFLCPIFRAPYLTAGKMFHASGSLLALSSLNKYVANLIVGHDYAWRHPLQ